MSSLNVPEEDQEGLVKLVALKKDSIDELLSALAEAPVLSSADELASLIAKKTKDISSEDIKAIARTIISFYYAKAYFGYSASDFAKAICEAIAKGLVGKIELSDEESRRFQDHLIKILSFDALATEIKARTLLRENEHLFCDARVITDLRPIFGSNPADPPIGAGIVHTLRIRYHEGSLLKEFFVALESSEIEDLRADMGRAKAKEESLKSILKSAGIPHVTIE